MKQIVQRQCGFLGHLLRKGDIKNQVIPWKVEGQRDRGRQRQEGKCIGRTGVDIICFAENRSIYCDVTANARI